MLVLKACKFTVHRSWHVKEILTSLIYQLITNSLLRLEIFITWNIYLDFLQEIITEYVLVHTYMSLLQAWTFLKFHLSPWKKPWKFPSLSLHFPFSSYETDFSLYKMELIINILLEIV